MTISESELEDLLYVERIHSGHFARWEERARDPLARLFFRMAADREENHVRWVSLLLEASRRRGAEGDLGVSLDELRYWIRDEGSEGDSYLRAAERASDPSVRTVLEQIAADEKANARLLRLLLERASGESGG